MPVAKKTPPVSTAFFRPEQWIHLLQQLEIIMATVHGDDSNPILRRFGVRRRSAIFRRLMQERWRLVNEIEAFGQAGLLAFVKSQMPDSSRPQRHLDVEFKLLGEAFDQCSKDLSPHTQAALQQWLLARSHMHREHARFLETY